MLKSSKTKVENAMLKAQDLKDAVEVSLPRLWELAQKHPDKLVDLFFHFRMILSTLSCYVTSSTLSINAEDFQPEAYQAACDIFDDFNDDFDLLEAMMRQLRSELPEPLLDD